MPSLVLIFLGSPCSLLALPLNPILTRQDFFNSSPLGRFYLIREGTVSISTGSSSSVALAEEDLPFYTSLGADFNPISHSMGSFT